MLILYYTRMLEKDIPGGTKIYKVRPVFGGRERTHGTSIAGRT